MRDNRGIDRDIGNTARAQRELWDAINALRSERRAPATSIGSGSLTIDGGDVIMLDTDGSVLFRLGTQTNGDRGISMYRQDSSEALSISKFFPASTQQEFRIRDRFGSEILGEEPLGSGIKHPYFQIPMQPVLATPATLQAGPNGWQVPLTATTFTTTHQAWYARLNQYGYFRLMISASDTTTAAEVQVIDVGTGAALSPFLGSPWTGTRAVGSTGYVEVASPLLFLPGTPDQQTTIAVQVRRSAGAGTLQVALPESRGA